MSSWTMRRIITNPPTTSPCSWTDRGIRALTLVTDSRLGMKAKNWFVGLWQRLRRGHMSTPDNFLETPGGQSLAWLADAPMFIDADQISAIYNAVARPEYATEKIT